MCANCSAGGPFGRLSGLRPGGRPPHSAMSLAINALPRFPHTFLVSMALLRGAAPLTRQMVKPMPRGLKARGRAQATFSREGISRDPADPITRFLQRKTSPNLNNLFVAYF